MLEVSGNKERKVSTVFRWKRSRWPSFRLCYLFFIVLSLHVAGFYLIDIAYPPSRKDLVRQASLYYLPADNPEVRRILARHEEALRVFGGLRGVESDLPQAAQLTLSFENYLPELLEDPPLATGGPRVVFPPLTPFATLPPPPAATRFEPRVAPEEPVVRLLPSGGDMEDATVHDPGLSEDEWQKVSGRVMRAEVGVDVDGRVLYCFVRNGGDPALDGRLREFMLRQRIPRAWLPEASGGISWLVFDLYFY